MNLLKPRLLKKGDTIGFLSVCGDIKDYSKLEFAKEYFQNIGFNVVISDSSKTRKNYLCGDDEFRAKSLNEFFADDSIDAIIATRGGYGAIRIIDLIDYELIKNHPKIFAGYSDITALSLMMYKRSGLITYNAPMAYSDFGSEISSFSADSFLSVMQNGIKEICIDPEVIKRQKDLKIVYTPLHGTGMMLIPQSLNLWGFENVHCVKEQMVKSGDFPTVVSPNPENGEALSLALRDAKEIDADIVMASDPDADRVGMACKNDKGEWILINGNQTCLLFLYYIITNRKAKGLMKAGDYIVKTIVTTEVIRKIADKQCIEMRDCYTGFKWIAREMALSEGKQQYIGGGEESYGFLAEDFVRDKDAVSACSLLAEICAYAKDQGKTLYDILMDIYIEYGFSKEFTVNVVKPGKTGADEIKQMMTNFRNNPPKELGGSKIIIWKDYQSLEQTTANGEKTKLDMPTTSNVLQWFCEDGTKVSVRPSGTEPKIKFYIEVKDSTMKCPNCYARCSADAEVKIEAIKKSLNL